MQEMLKSRAALPIADLKGEILHSLEENDVLVICGETGCGKTTQVLNSLVLPFLCTKLLQYCVLVQLSLLFRCYSYVLWFCFFALLKNFLSVVLVQQS